MSLQRRYFPMPFFSLFTVDGIIADSTETMRNQKGCDHQRISGIAVDIWCAQQAVY